MRYLLDTSALLAHYRQETGWETVQAIFESGDAEIVVASVSLTEFGRRLRDLGVTEEEMVHTLTRYQLLFSAVAVLDRAVALSALMIASRAARRLPLVDALIAAVAQARDSVLVHRDEHMRSIPTELIQQIDLAT